MSLTDEQSLQFKNEGRPCLAVKLKNKSSDSVAAVFLGCVEIAEKNSYFHWSCLAIGDWSIIISIKIQKEESYEKVKMTFS